MSYAGCVWGGGVVLVTLLIFGGATGVVPHRVARGTLALATPSFPEEEDRIHPCDQYHKRGQNAVATEVAHFLCLHVEVPP